MTVTLPDELARRIEGEARWLGVTPEERAISLLDDIVTAQEDLDVGLWELARGLDRLKVFIARLPAVGVISTSKPGEPDWWLKFDIDIEHPLAWHVVQSLGFVLNYISLESRLPTRFHPVSPPPYLNGGPGQYLAWVIEASWAFLNAGDIVDVLAARLPDPVEDESKWDFDAAEEGEENED